VKPAERQHVINRYAERVERLGPVVQALGWRDDAQQQLRFDVLAGGLGDLTGASVLDVGCGFGDFLTYLDGRWPGVRFTGCDLAPSVLDVARARHPQAAFDQRDVLETPYADGSFDYVTISGIFNHLIEDNEGFLQNMLAASFKMARKGVAANMVTDAVDYQDAGLYYFNPERVLGYCRALSRRVALRHDYPLYEFTVFIYRSA